MHYGQSMDAFPLQSELIDGVIGFANADLSNRTQISSYFNGTLKPDQIPILKTRRTIQADVRLWLMTASGFDNRESYLAMRGVEDNYDGSVKRVDLGIRFEGYLTVEETPVLGGYKEQIVFKWRVSKASLRAICGLAVQIIIQEGLHQRVGECERESCQNIYLDRTSRGIRRKYCKSAECGKILNRERVKESRKKVRK